MDRARLEPREEAFEVLTFRAHTHGEKRVSAGILRNGKAHTCSRITIT